MKFYTRAVKEMVEREYAEELHRYNEVFVCSKGHLEKLCARVEEAAIREAIEYAVRECTPDIGNPMIGDYNTYINGKIGWIHNAYLTSREK